MARPRKCRRVCGMPRNNSFAPMGLLDSVERVVMAVDEYEKGLIRYACEKYGSTRKVAKAIGISQTQLVRKKKKYNL